MRSKSLTCFAIAALLLALPAFGQSTTLFSTVGPGFVQPDDFAPPGNLFDNDVANGTTSLASQNSTGTFFARTADDFTIDNAAQGCASGIYEVTEVRVQATQADAAAQAFGVDLYDGDASTPLPINAAAPFATLVETGQTNLGPFGVGTTLFEASFGGAGTILSGDTVYWLSAFGTDGAANPAGFNNFFAASNGAAGTTPNGVIIAPDAGVATWTAVDAVIGPPPLAFSFAIDGFCVAPETPTIDIPTLGQFGLVAMLLSLVGAGLYRIRRRR
ncbi:MAG: hypothetical protein AAF657_08650 [Acidobacteriota bacterium]